MSDGDRSFLAPAIIGLIVTAAGLGAWGASQWANAPDDYPSYYEAAADQKSTAVTAPVKALLNPSQKKQPCHDSRSRDESDLCAQWRAAKAAERAADYGWWQAVLSFFGVIGLGATLAFNWLTIRMALKGQKDSERSLRASEKSASASARASQAASESNQIARETMQRQLRPHIYVVTVTAKKKSRGRLLDLQTTFIEAHLVLRNFGQTPAKKVTLHARLFVGGFWNDDFPHALEGAATVPLGTIPPDIDCPQSPYTTTYPMDEHFDLTAAMKSIFIEGQIQYADDFGETYWTNFRQACSGVQDMETYTFRPCPHWNEAI